MTTTMTKMKQQMNFRKPIKIDRIDCFSTVYSQHTLEMKQKQIGKDEETIEYVEESERIHCLNGIRNENIITAATTKNRGNLIARALNTHLKIIEDYLTWT